ncbi:MAG: hypothetical protein VR69_00130 [Peptococcaceae bacterium BRH_c4b]|nr:MAG: hypothetical protein VR69_00130 [Peptococcaceae bacterium BRH_c4b]
MDWLPELVKLEDYGGNWERFIEEVYNIFKLDFIKNKPDSFKGKRFGIKRHPLLNDKEATFWHITSEGKIETERIPELRRCERIRWPRAIIDNYTNEKILCWENTRGTEKRIVMWFRERDYVVVLADRIDYILLWTAYCVKYNHTRIKLQKEYDSSIKC